MLVTNQKAGVRVPTNQGPGISCLSWAHPCHRHETGWMKPILRLGHQRQSRMFCERLVLGRGRCPGLQLVVVLAPGMSLGSLRDESPGPTRLHLSSLHRNLASTQQSSVSELRGQTHSWHNFEESCHFSIRIANSNKNDDKLLINEWYQCLSI